MWIFTTIYNSIKKTWLHLSLHYTTLHQGSEHGRRHRVRQPADSVLKLARATQDDARSGGETKTTLAYMGQGLLASLCSLRGRCRLLPPHSLFRYEAQASGSPPSLFPCAATARALANRRESGITRRNESSRGGGGHEVCIKACEQRSERGA